MQAGVGLLDTAVMPIYMIIPRYSYNYAQFYQLLDSNLFTHRNTYAIMREATSETYGPRVYLLSYKFTIYIRAHFANNREGIDNPFITSGASWCSFVQVFGGLSIVSYWIDTLVLKR